MKHCIETAGIGFCLATAFHPAFRFAGPSRREIGIPTVFNLLGPMANPGRVRRQVIGVANAAFAERMVETLRSHGSRHAWVVHGMGLDELTTTGRSEVIELDHGTVRHFRVDPEALGLARAHDEDLVGGDPAVNAAVVRSVLAGDARSAPRHRGAERRRRPRGGRACGHHRRGRRARAADDRQRCRGDHARGARDRVARSRGLTMQRPDGGWVIRVPASSANLGAGFDVLGMALTLHAEFGVGDAPDGTRLADAHHPADIAFRRLGGSGPAVDPLTDPGRPRARLQRSGPRRRRRGRPRAARRPSRRSATTAARAEVLAVTAELEHHADNVAASIYGGVVIAAGGTVTRVPLAIDPAVLVWVPDATTTSTDHSRSRLPDAVSRDDAVFNIGRVAMFVAACAAGDPSALRAATEDRLHQSHRLAQVPASAAALDAALSRGAWAAWLSGSGPTVAALCDLADAERLAAALPADGHVKVLRIDHAGVVATAPRGT